MAAGELDITIEQGSTFERTITMEDSAGDPINLAGATVAGQMRRSYSDTTAIAFTMTVSDAAAGEITWVLPAATSAALSSSTRNYVYDIEVTHSSGNIERILMGKATLSPEVTR